MIKSNTFEQLVTIYTKKTSDHIYEKCVKRVQEKKNMSRYRLDSKPFQNFDCARYATGVSFQQRNRPPGNGFESKVYFAGKHRLYGFKVELSTLSSKLGIGCTAHYSGSVAELEVFWKNKDLHENASKK